jgi:hypothetical protein
MAERALKSEQKRKQHKKQADRRRNENIAKRANNMRVGLLACWLILDTIKSSTQSLNCFAIILSLAD